MSIFAVSRPSATGSCQPVAMSGNRAPMHRYRSSHYGRRSHRSVFPSALASLPCNELRSAPGIHRPTPPVRHVRQSRQTVSVRGQGTLLLRSSHHHPCVSQFPALPAPRRDKNLSDSTSRAPNRSCPAGRGPAVQAESPLPALRQVCVGACRHCRGIQWLRYPVAAPSTAHDAAGCLCRTLLQGQRCKICMVHETNTAPRINARGVAASANAISEAIRSAGL